MVDGVLRSRRRQSGECRMAPRMRGVNFTPEVEIEMPLCNL